MVKLPFRHNPKIASRNARLHRLKRKGIIKPVTKAEQRQAGLNAIRWLKEHPNATAAALVNELTTEQRDFIQCMAQPLTALQE